MSSTPAMPAINLGRNLPNPGHLQRLSENVGKTSNSHGLEHHFLSEPASLAPIKTTHLHPDSCIPIFMYKNNLLGWDLGTWVLGGTWGQGVTGCRYQSVHKQPFRLGLGDVGLGGDLVTRRQGVGIKVYINNRLGWDLGTLVRAGLGDKETWCRYQSVHKQPFRLGLGDLGLGGTWGQGDRV